MKKILSGVLILIMVTGISPAFADHAYKGDSNTTKIIHLGYLQLAAHDFFDMDRTTETDNENGKLDLSTVLFDPKQGDCNFQKSMQEKDGCSLYDDEAIANGGEIRSVESILISSASAEVGETYLQLAEMYGEKRAYGMTLEFYHKQLHDAYEESFHLKFPSPKKGEVSHIHNLAMRTGHDFLPAEIMFNGQQTSVFIIDPLGEKLSQDERMQQSSPVDGVFEEEFRGIDFCPVPGVFCIKVDLLEADRTFGEQFGLGADTFDEFLAGLEDGSFDKNEEVSKLLDEAFSYGLYFN